MTRNQKANMQKKRHVKSFKQCKTETFSQTGGTSKDPREFKSITSKEPLPSMITNWFPGLEQLSRKEMSGPSKTIR